MRHAPAFIDGLQEDGRGLKAAGAGDVPRFLEAASRGGAPQDRRFRQCVQAIEILPVEVGGLPWVLSVNVVVASMRSEGDDHEARLCGA